MHAAQQINVDKIKEIISKIVVWSINICTIYNNINCNRLRGLQMDSFQGVKNRQFSKYCMHEGFVNVCKVSNY